MRYTPRLATLLHVRSCRDKSRALGDLQFKLSVFRRNSGHSEPTAMMMRISLGLTLCCAALFAVATALPSGAPASTCTTLLPGAQSSHGPDEQTTANPWMIDLSAFPAANGSYYYIPDTTYDGKNIINFCNIIIHTPKPALTRFSFSLTHVHTHSHSSSNC